MEKLAVIQVRGTIGVDEHLKSTLKSLRLHSQNYCTIIPKTPEYLGMIQIAKDFITWGEIDDSTYAVLVEKRGEEFKGTKKETTKYLAEGSRMLKKYFRLNPPRKGYGRKGTKQAFTDGGALGYRGAKINDLIQRMM